MSFSIGKDEWFAKLERYRAAGGNAARMAESRVRGVAWGPSVWDWDDNIPEAWGVELAEKWGLVRDGAA